MHAMDVSDFQAHLEIFKCTACRNFISHLHVARHPENALKNLGACQGPINIYIYVYKYPIYIYICISINIFM